MSFKPSDTLSEFEAVAALENCIRDVRTWMKEDMLWLNDVKTEFLLIGRRQQLAKVSIDSIKVGDADIARPVSSAIRNLETWFDSHMEMSTRISKTCGNILLSPQYSSHQETEKNILHSRSLL